MDINYNILLSICCKINGKILITSLGHHLTYSTDNCKDFFSREFLFLPIAIFYKYRKKVFKHKYNRKEKALYLEVNITEKLKK